MMSSKMCVSMKRAMYKRIAGRMAMNMAQIARGFSVVPVGEISHPLSGMVV